MIARRECGRGNVDQDNEDTEHSKGGEHNEDEGGTDNDENKGE